jgi:hypothetical protein
MTQKSKKNKYKHYNKFNQDFHFEGTKLENNKIFDFYYIKQDSILYFIFIRFIV